MFDGIMMPHTTATFRGRFDCSTTTRVQMSNDTSLKSLVRGAGVVDTPTSCLAEGNCFLTVFCCALRLYARCPLANDALSKNLGSPLTAPSGDFLFLL